MIMRVLLPHLGTNLPRAVVTEWHVAAGSDVAFGSPICDVSVSDRMRVTSGSSRANILLRVARQGGSRSGSELESDRFTVRYQVVASEPAKIIEVRAEVGSVVEVGSLLAVAQVGQEEKDDSLVGVEEAPGLRVVASIAQPEASP
jgi:pyruvate/2-oxoglutarate dehydrogenase complex dihydrolipoamide acyltransferase (E2) component